MVQMPDVDLLASRRINKLDRFVYRTRVLQVFVVDALIDSLGSVFPDLCLSITEASSMPVSLGKSLGHSSDSVDSCLGKDYVVYGHCKSLGS